METRTLQISIVPALLAVFAMARDGLRLVIRGLGFLAESAQPMPADDPPNSSIRGGLLNFRTGKFDDGTDPSGIYKLD